MLPWLNQDGKNGPACVILTAPAEVGASVMLGGIAGEVVPTVPLKLCLREQIPPALTD